MDSDEDTPALVALLRAGGRSWAAYIVAARRAGGVQAGLAPAVLAQEFGLLAYAAMDDAVSELKMWKTRGYRLFSVLDAGYPDNLRSVENRPPLLFIAGELCASDSRSVSVIGTRSPSECGCQTAASVAEGLSAAGYSVFSGLACGIDARVHTAVLQCGGRTVAVIGTGLDHAYPRENAHLQERIALESAVVSQCWPDAQPTRQSFPARNALMSGLTLGSVIVEASPTSGTRVQARHALSQGRKLVLMDRVLGQDWAKELVGTPGVSVAQTADDVLAAFHR